MKCAPAQSNMYTELLANYHFKEHTRDIKYKVLLVAYKDLDKADEEALQYYFISNITSESSINGEGYGVEKTCVGMTFRMEIYHNWFRQEILEKLNEGYKLGVIEMPKSYSEMWESKLKELQEKYHIIIVDIEEV